MILLSGEVGVYCKVLEAEGKKKLKKKERELLHGQYIKIGDYH